MNKQDKEKSLELYPIDKRDLLYQNHVKKLLRKAFLNGCKWKEQQFAKTGYTKEQLLSMGFGFTLNGDIVTPKEEEDMTKKYLEYQKQQMIQKAVEWMKDRFHATETRDLYIEDFKRTMMEE